jgi:hypothetical protein
LHVIDDRRNSDMAGAARKGEQIES